MSLIRSVLRRRTPKAQDANFGFLCIDCLQVLRYSALIFGVFYGFQHQRSITSHGKAAHAQAEYKHKEDLIQKAKLEWSKKSLPKESKTASGDGELLRTTKLVPGADQD